MLSPDTTTSAFVRSCLIYMIVSMYSESNTTKGALLTSDYEDVVVNKRKVAAAYGAC